MHRTYKISFLLILLALLLVGCSNNHPNVGGNLKYENDEENLAYQNSIIENTANTEQQISRTSTSSENAVQNLTLPAEEPIKEETITEEKLSEFKTKIYDKDSERQHNLELTCTKLNEHIVKSGETFSFCNIVGKATSSAGYEKAKIFDKNGNVKEGYGGGNCQVSTTIFNAVKKLSGIEVIERHNHSNKVPYAKAGNDAAVAYGSYDFKFINHNDYDIIIHAEATKSNVIITINKIG